MFTAVFASLRIAFALVCVGLSLLLGAQWLGLIPDRTLHEIQVRRHWAQTAVASIQGDLQDRQYTRLRRQLRHLADSEASVVSIGLRDRTGYLIAATADHEVLWPARPPGPDIRPPAAAATSPASGMPTVLPPEMPKVLPTVVPIQSGRRVWGTMEVAFEPPPSRLLGGTLDGGIAPLLIFFATGGMIGYAALMLRLMKVFRKTQVVPERVRGALDTLAEGVLVLDGAGKIMLANDSFAASIGSPAAELVGADACLLRWVATPEADGHPNDAELQTAGPETATEFSSGFSPKPESDTERRGGLPIEAFPWMRTLKNRQSIVDRRLDLIDSDGQRRNYAINAAPLGDGRQQKGALVTFQDITHREQNRRAQEAAMRQLRHREKVIQQKNAELEILATRDALTGCLNRRAFFERTEPLLADHRLGRQPISCVMVDVDHFKSVNDTYGHHTGDEVLREVAATLRQLHEPEHLVCRYGGEEFCIVFPGLDTQTAAQKAEQTRRAIAAIRLTEPASLRLTASLGVSGLEFDPADTQGMINQADECLYAAKRGGRNRVVTYDPDLTPSLASNAAADAATAGRGSMAATGEPGLADAGELDRSDRGGGPDRVDARIAPAAVTRSDDRPGQNGSPPGTSAAVRLPMNLITPLVAAMTLRDPRLGRRARVHADRCLAVAEGRLEHGMTYRLEIAALLSEFGLIGAPQDSLDRWIGGPELPGGPERPGGLGCEPAEPTEAAAADAQTLGCYLDGQAMVAETFGCPVLRQILVGDIPPGRLSGPQREATRLASEILRLAAVDQVPPWASPLSERASEAIRPQTRELCQSAGWLQSDSAGRRQVSPGHRPVADDLAWMRRPHHGEEQTTGIALAISRLASGQIRGMITEIAEAVERAESVPHGDREVLRRVVERVRRHAEKFGLHPIVQSATQTDVILKDDDAPWRDVLGHIGELTQLCRKTDNAHLGRPAAEVLA